MFVCNEHCKEERAQHSNTHRHPLTPKKEIFFLSPHTLFPHSSLSLSFSLLRCHPPLCHLLSGWIPSFFSLHIHLLSLPFCLFVAVFVQSLISLSLSLCRTPPSAFPLPWSHFTYSGTLMLFHNHQRQWQRQRHYCWCCCYMVLAYMYV